MSYSVPRPLEPADDVSKFDCGEPSFNEFLTKRALANNLSGASRTFVTTSEQLVAGCYTLAAGGVQNSDAPGKVRRNQPRIIPVVILARPAVDRTHQGSGLGSHLLRDAIVRTVRSSRNLGVRALLVHALGEEARRFYRQYDFTPSPTDELHLYLLIKDVERLFKHP